MPTGLVKHFDAREGCPGFWHLRLSAGKCPLACTYCYREGTTPARVGRNEYRVYEQADLEKAVDRWLRLSDERFEWRLRGRLPVHGNVLVAGESCDALVEPVLHHSKWLVPRFAPEHNPHGHTLLLRTKSVNVPLAAPHPHVVVEVSAGGYEEWEQGTSNTADGVGRMVWLRNQDWRVRWRMDPLKPDNFSLRGQFLAWRYNEGGWPELITLGTLRATAATYRKWPPQLQALVEREQPGKVFVLTDSQVYEVPEKPMHPWRVEPCARFDAYRDIMAALRSAGATCPIALCKEGKPMWAAVGLTAFEHCTCTA